MDSPTLLQLSENIKIEYAADRAIYLQLADAVVTFIKSGNWVPGKSGQVQGMLQLC